MEIRRKEIFRALLLFGIIIALLAYAIKTTIYDDTDTLSSISEAPNFTLEEIDGLDVHLENYRGKGVFLNFWASWCEPCEREMPKMNEVYASGIDNVEILAVNLMEDKDAVVRFKNKYELKFPILLDQSNEVGRQYNIIYYPTTILINEHGEIIDRIVGELHSTEQIESLMMQISAGER